MATDARNADRIWSHLKLTRLDTNYVLAINWELFREDMLVFGGHACR